ncbi:long-chain-fatty-acid--CoA ligase [Desulfovibrio inopinatus]|uniref:long-chain-fatty-acid--CoA ligase n=1 Tax=Desulfovibrio inopinatus TaxID=102109 RepID=UPI0004197EC0|nr:long-chain fatty acid--CoA ligase [Desulfovibrio inopinatus]
MADTFSRPWLSQYADIVKNPMSYEEKPLFSILDAAAESSPKRTAIRFKNTHISYQRLRTLSETVAGGLAASGYGPGDRIAIMLPNLPQTIIAYLGVLKAGCTVVMVNPLYMDTELNHILSDASIKALFILDRLYVKHKTLLDQHNLNNIYVTGIADGLSFPLNLIYPFKARKEGTHPYIPYDWKHVQPFSLLTSGKTPLSVSTIDPKRDLAAIQYTGGTTGLAKGVMLSHFNLLTNVAQCRAMLHSIGEKPEVFLGLLPYFHIYGLTVCLNYAMACRATLVPVPRFIPLETLKAIHKTKPTVFPGAPSVYIALMQQKDFERYDVSSITYCVSGSAPMPVELMERFEKVANAKILEGYGLSEASPVTHLNPISGKRKAGSIGLPFPDTDARIVDLETGTQDMPIGQPGELIVKGPQVMQGYLNQPEETNDALRDGWLYTGDIAVMDDEGYFFIVDRKKDIILAGGFNVYPREVEEALYEYPDVAEAVVFGAPHHTRGEIVKAVIVPREGTSPQKSDVLLFLRKRLAHYKVPKSVEIRDTLPKSMVGKVLRRVLREEEKERIDAQHTSA